MIKIHKALVILFVLLGFSATSFGSEEEKKISNEISDWQARLELARVLSYQKKYDEAQKEYERIIQEHPDRLEPKMEMSKMFFYKGEPSRAIALLEEIPQDKWDDETKVFMAIAYGSQKQFDKAESLFQEHLKSHPTDLKAKLKYAEILSWEKKYDESVKEFQQLLQEKPDDKQIRRKYALVLIWMGKRDEGAEELKKTLNP